MLSRAAGLALGYLADQLLADPRRGHPVAGFGRLAQSLEQRLWHDNRRAGVGYTMILVGGAVAAGVVAERATAGRPLRHTLATATVTWAVLGGRSLAEEAAAVHELLDGDDLTAARRRLTHLVGRDTALLDQEQVARAVVESVAENTSDAVVGSLLAGSVAGLPGLLAHRATNTLDAMVGHRDPRYARFGWAAARLDDLVNLVPARLAAALAVAAAPLLGGDSRAALSAWLRDGRRHPSPNAGPVEAAFAGALGVRLGGRTTYRDRTEHRPTLGAGRPVGPGDIPRATRLAALVDAGALAVSLAVSSRPRRAPRRRPRRGR